MKSKIIYYLQSLFIPLTFLCIVTSIITTLTFGLLLIYNYFKLNTLPEICLLFIGIGMIYLSYQLLIAFKDLLKYFK